MNDQSASEPRILKIANCSSLSGRTTLTYHVGCYDERNVCFRIWTTNGKGVFSKEWTSAFDINSVLAENPSLAAPILLPIFKKSRSVNTAGFLLAALKNEGLVKPSPDVAHQYLPVPSESFVQDVSALIASSVDLNPSDVSQAHSSKPRKRARSSSSSTLEGVEATYA